MSASLLLDKTTWDLVPNGRGGFALTTDLYQEPANKELYTAMQRVSNAVRLFLGEIWLNTPRGIPYFQNILGKQPPATFLRATIENMATTVPGVAKARCVITKFDATRNVQGQIQITLASGATGLVRFS